MVTTPSAMPPTTPPPINPYRPPSSNVADIAPPSGLEFAAPGIRADAGRGASWISEGWNLFKQAPLMWLVILVIIVGVNVVPGLIPGAGHILTTLVAPIFNIGLLAFAKGLDNGEGADINRFFIGFQSKFGVLIGIGALSLAMMIVALIIAVILAIFIIGAGSIRELVSASPQTMAEILTTGTVGWTLLFMTLVFLALVLLAASATYFAPGRLLCQLRCDRCHPGKFYRRVAQLAISVCIWLAGYTAVFSFSHSLRFGSIRFDPGVDGVSLSLLPGDFWPSAGVGSIRVGCH
jgi:hypothetical protein